jgi:hypothetical protein
MKKYSIVTVVFEGDVELMYLQARSMNLYCDPSLIEEIIVVDNFTAPKPKRWEEKLLQFYGRMATKVRIVPATNITDTHGIPGWFSQQALKLAVARIVKTDRYVILDAKNHLIKPLTRDFLETVNGKVRINGYGYETHPLLRYLEKTCAYVGLDISGPIERFVRTSTPFTMVTSATKAMVDNIEAREGKDLALVISEHGLTEFFLYAGHLQHNGVLDELYDWTQPFSPDIWKWGAEDLAIIQEAVDKAQLDTSGPFFSVHRGAIPLFAPAGREIICKLWTERSLFLDEDIAFEFLSNIRS